MSLLIEEYPLVVLPSLAEKIGLNEAIFLQQVHYWLKNPSSGAVIDGCKWVYNSIPEWRDQFPFWSEATIKRAISSLRKKGLLIAEKLHKDRRVHTLYYRIDYEKLKDKERENSKAQCEPMDKVKMTRRQGQNDLIPNSTETTTETTTDIVSGNPDDSPSPSPIEQVIEYLNLKVGTKFRADTKTNVRLIESRLREGATVEQMLNVIDYKCKEWMGTKMQKYLRPATLFNAEKYEQYVGQLNVPIVNQNTGGKSADPHADAWSEYMTEGYGNNNTPTQGYDLNTIEMERPDE